MAVDLAGLDPPGSAGSSGFGTLGPPPLSVSSCLLAVHYLATATRFSLSTLKVVVLVNFITHKRVYG